MKRFTLGTSALVAVTVSFLLTACGGTAPTEEPGQTPGLTPKSQPERAATTQERPNEQSPARTMEEQRIFLSTEYMKRARAAYDLGDYKSAFQYASSALEVDGNNSETRDFHSKVAAQLGDRNEEASDIQKRISDLEQARVEKTHEKVEELLMMADVALSQRSYDLAVRHCDDALLAIRYNVSLQKGGKLERTVLKKRGFIVKAIAEDRQLHRKKLAQQASDELEQQEIKKRERRIYKIQRLFTQAKMAFGNGRYDDCAENLKVILALDPASNAARKLLEITRNASYENNRRLGEMNWKTEWAKTFEDLKTMDIPMNEKVSFDERHWLSKVIDRKPLEGFQVEEGDDDIENAAILEKLRATMVDPTFTEAELDEWVKYFQQVTEVNFLVSSAVREMDMEETALTNVRIPKMPADAALGVISKLTPLRWKITNGVVKIVTAEESFGRIFTRFYDVRDLVQQLQNFVAGEIYLASADAEIEPPEVPEPKPIVIEPESLIDVITTNMPAGSFEMEGATITIQNNVIVARSTKEVHGKMAKLLSDLRINTGILVNVEARFLRVEDKFLEEIGVDFRGLGDDASRGVAGKGLEKQRSRPATRFDDFGTGTTPTTPGELGTGTEPGIFYDDGNDGDYMARTENLFDQALGNPTEGMTNAGGLGLQYTYLDDTELEAILRAVSKRERVEQIHAPSLTVFNTQRAHLTVTRQVSYVKDFDVEIAQAAAVANPVVGTVADGVVLDVQPVVSADRRYIKMELRPTLAQLERPIPTYSTTLGVGQEITIQLPKLQIQRVRTTVTIPDGGTLMLGGMKLTNKQDYNSGVPLLKDLPLLSFFFSRRGTYSSNRKVFILLKASIVIPPEMEPRKLVQDN